MAEKKDTADIKAVPGVAYGRAKTRKTRYERVMEGLGIWTAFYRANPHRFAVDYLGMTWMRPFQKIMMNIILKFNNQMIIASRGMGKTQIVAACIAVKAILYPGIQICIAAGNRSQSVNVLEKIISEFCSRSINLANEIQDKSLSPQNAYIKFKNGSKVTVVTARDSARSARAHWLVNDEFVRIKEKVIDEVLRKFKAGQRHPGYLDLPEYSEKDFNEPNTETYISSAHYKWHYSWTKFKSYFKDMMSGNNYAVVGFPYQLPVSEGYYPLEQVQDEMREADFDSVAFSMEMESMFWGESANAFFTFQNVDNVRKLAVPMYPVHTYSLLPDNKFRQPVKKNGEIRLLAMDVAAMGGSKNDASSICLIQMIPGTGGKYQRLVSYMETMEGGHGQAQAIRLKQLYDDFEADYVVIDSNGIGLSVYDSLVVDLFDEERGCSYEPWSCINDERMAVRSKTPSENKIIYSIKATQAMNSDMAVLLRDCMKRGKIKFLSHEEDGREVLSSLRGWDKLSPEEQVALEAPYYQTTAFCNETINLNYDIVNGKIRVQEASGARKDRYSSVAYGNYIADTIEREMLKYNTSDFAFAPNCVSAVSF